MIICPLLKVAASPGYDSSKPSVGHSSSQGAVSWMDCLSCKCNRGADIKKGKVKCGHDPDNIITIESIPI